MNRPTASAIDSRRRPRACPGVQPQYSPGVQAPGEWPSGARSLDIRILMGIEEFPEIEAFQKLPRRIIVKGGISTVNEENRAELSGIVINNVGQPIKDLKVNLILFDQHEMPAFSTSVSPDPAHLFQGGIASFKFVIEGHKEKITNYYLYPTWQYDDSGWS